MIHYSSKLPVEALRVWYFNKYVIVEFKQVYNEIMYQTRCTMQAIKEVKCCN